MKRISKFSVKTKQARAQAADELRMVRELESLGASVRSISNNLGFKIACKANIRTRLNHAAGQIDGHQRDMRRMHSALADILDAYDKTEQRILSESVLQNWSQENTDGNTEDSVAAAVGASVGTAVSPIFDLFSGVSCARQGCIEGTLCDSFFKNLNDDIESKVMEKIGDASDQLGTLIKKNNINIRIGGPNKFVTVNSKIASKVLSAGGKTLAAGAKYGMPIVNGIIDYWSLREDGNSPVDAGVKTVAHCAIGLAGGETGAAIGAAVGTAIPVPVVGTVVGAAVGFIAGAAITTLGSFAFDKIYDSREELGQFFKEKLHQVDEAVDQTVVSVKGFFSDVGAAVSSEWKRLGAVFG